MKPFTPSLHLQDRIASISVVKSLREERTVLPGASAVLGFQLSGRVRAGQEWLSSAGVTGIQQAARRYDYLDDTVSILVRFTPQGATCLGVPASALAARSLSLDALLSPAKVRELTDRLVETPAQAVAHLEDFIARLPYQRDRLITRALTMIEEAPARDTLVSSVARALEISERQLERRFLQRVGLTPKRYAALRRFERAVSLVQGAASLTSAALEAGYYDQSHFIREFRRFAGTTPTDYLQRPPLRMSDLYNRK